MKNLIAISLIILSLIFNFTRLEFVEKLVNVYESQTGKVAPLVVNPFTDTNNEAVIKAYGLEITAGTTSQTFTPNRNILPYESFLMVGRLLEAIDNAQ